jgi:hypothetical protein
MPASSRGARTPFSVRDRALSDHRTDELTKSPRGGGNNIRARSHVRRHFDVPHAEPLGDRTRSGEIDLCERERRSPLVMVDLAQPVLLLLRENLRHTRNSYRSRKRHCSNRAEL